MSQQATTPHPSPQHHETRGGQGDAPAHREALGHAYVMTTTTRRALAVLRIGFGLTFLWPFFDKLFGLGFSTKPADAWLSGGNPTLGYLKFGSKGPFKDLYGAIAGDAWVNVVFMAALLALGIALTFGIGMKLAGIGGAILYVMMWTVYLPPDTNPVLDDHILGAISVAVLALTMAGNTWGLGHVWSKTALVQRLPILR